MAQETLHYIGETLIGDVHPYFDGDTCYMYYLKPGTFESALLTSEDMIEWTETDIRYEGTRPANYYVLGVLKEKETFRTWFGSSISMLSSQSADLICWKSGGKDTEIPMGYEAFPAGIRDPFVFYDEQEKVYRMVCTAYETNQLQGKGLAMKAAIGHAQTAGDDPTDWGPVDRALVKMNGLKGEPECPMAMKIGNRWYLFASMARRTENHVGRLSYFIGEADAGFLDQDWNTKQEHFLTSEDLCAPQLAYRGEELYLFGWIVKQWYGDVWGGHLSLPLEVYQEQDGKLYTRLPAGYIEKIRGEALGENASTFVLETAFTLAQEECFRLSFGTAGVLVDAKEGCFAVDRGRMPQKHVSFDLPKEALVGDHTLRIIAEEDMLEVYLDDRWSLSARIEGEVWSESLKVLQGQEIFVKFYGVQNGK